MLRLMFLLFITAPLAELYVLIRVGAGIGGLNTILLCLLTAALGGLIIRWQGLATLLDARHRLAMGELPAEHAVHGALLALAGLFLFTPGFITDTAGFLLLTPPVRRWLVHRLIPPVPRAPGSHGDIIDADIVDTDIQNPDRRPPDRLF